MRGITKVLLAIGCVTGLVTAVLAMPTAGSASAGDPTSNQVAFDYFLGKGLTAIQAAGVVGNLDQESGMSPTAVQSGGPGRGIAQWSAGGRWDTSYHDNVVWYAGSQYDTLAGQLDFIWYELTNFSGYGLSALQAATSVTGAVVAFQDNYEACGACDQSARVSYASAALSDFGSDAPPNAWAGMNLNSNGYQRIFVTTSTGAVAERYDTPDGWSWGTIGGTALTGAPAVNYFPDTNEYDVYATGTDGKLWVKQYVAGAWGCCWTLIDGPALRPGVSAMLDKYGHQHIFATGTNGAVYNIRNADTGANGKNGTWAFGNIGGTVLTGTPGVNYYPASNEYYVYATGANGHLYLKKYDGDSWACCWTDLGDHNLAGGAAAMVDKYGHQHVFAVTTSGAIYNARNISGSTWTWDSIDGTILTGTPKLQYVPTSNTYNVWAAGTNGVLYHKEYADDAWWTSYHDFSGTTSINVTG